LEALEDRFLLSTYSTVILGDHPAAYYRLGETSGTTAFDSSGNSHDGTYLGGPTLGLPGALAGDPDTSVQFNGVSYTAGSIVDTNYSASDVSFTIEGWVRPTAAVAQEWVIAGRSGGGGHLLIMLGMAYPNLFMQPPATRESPFSMAPPSM
jgi:hypothetical protein